MPNCDYYAMGEDHRRVLEFVLNSGECDVFESSSRVGHETVLFRSLGDFEDHFGITNWAEMAEGILLGLHVREAAGLVQQRRIDLVKSEFFPEGGFRYSTDGWGLIQLYLQVTRRGGLSPSHTNHNSPERAANWRDVGEDRLGDPSTWNWKKVASFSRRLNAFIRKQAVDKRGARVVLPGAVKLREGGEVEFSLN